MMNRILPLLLLLSFYACAGHLRNPASRNNKDYPVCTAKTKASGDVSLYWELASDSDADGKLKDICEVSVTSLHPTQFAVGMIEVQRKVKNLRELSKKELDKYQKKNPEPIVIGPKGEFFIIDHHHLARALNDIGIASTYGIILENWYGADEEKFWKYLKEKNWVYLVDKDGAKRTVSDLAGVKTVRDLKDDPYRSLAGQTRCKVEKKCEDGNWLKVPVPFIEFLWAEHFRRTPSVVNALKTYEETDFDKVTKAASREVTRLRGKLPEN